MKKLNLTDHKIQIRKGLQANLDSAKATAIEGEPHYTTDTKALYIFDGTTNVIANQTPFDSRYLKLDATNGPVTGPIAFQNTTDSTTAFRVNQADGTNVLNVDTTNQQVSVGGVQSGIDGRTRLFLRNRTDNVNLPALVIGNLAGTQNVGFGINSNGWMQFTSTQNRASFIVNITEFGVGNAFTTGFFYGYYTNRFEFANRTGKLIFGSSSTATGDYITTMTLEDYRAGINIGNATPNGAFEIVGAEDVKQLIVKANATQTANLTEWQNSSGTPLASMSATGMFTTAGRRKAVTTKTADYTATINDEVIKFTSNATLTLPSATGSGQHYLVRAVGCTVVIDGAGTDTVNEELTQTLYGGDSVQIVDDGLGTWGVY